MDQEIARVRSFNRSVTQRIGALEDHFLGRDRPLGESRLLYEIGPDGADVRDLRARLGLDSGYASRLLRSLERRKLVKVSPASSDRRIRHACLTDAGRSELDELNRRSDELAASLLESLSASRRERLLRAMAEVELFIQAPHTKIEVVPVDGTDARWCLEQYYTDLARLFVEGFEPARHGGPRPAELAPPRGVFLVARLDGRPIGCGALTTQEPAVGYITRMWVAESARGAGLGVRILDALEAHAVRLGHRRVRLDTNRALHRAQAMYRRHGYLEVERFNSNPYANHWFEKDLPLRVTGP